MARVICSTFWKKANGFRRLGKYFGLCKTITIFTLAYYLFISIDSVCNGLKAGFQHLSDKDSSCHLLNNYCVPGILLSTLHVLSNQVRPITLIQVLLLLLWYTAGEAKQLLQVTILGSREYSKVPTYDFSIQDIRHFPLRY